MPEIQIISAHGCSPYHFGVALAARGDRLLVGSPYRYYAARKDEPIPPPVAALFTWSGSAWGLTQSLTAADPAGAEGFGRAVALSDSFAVIGAPGYDNGDGPVHVFKRADDSSFRLAATLDAPGPRPFDDLLVEYAAAIASDGRQLVVGAPLELSVINPCDAGSAVGAIHIFAMDSPSPRLLATHSGSIADEGLGSAIALSEGLLLVGAPAIYSNGTLPGAAYLFSRDSDGRWRELRRLGGRDPGEQFGAAVAIDGPCFAVGAPGRSFQDQPSAGRVDVFRVDGDECPCIGSIADRAGFGRAVALRGDRLAVGQPDWDAPDGTARAGRAALCRIDGAGGIDLQAWLIAPQATEYARLGSAVALGPDYVAAGAPGLGEDDDWSGFVLTARLEPPKAMSARAARPNSQNGSLP